MKTIEREGSTFERQKPGMECLYGALEPLLPSRVPPPGPYMALGPANLPAWFQAALAPALGTGLRVCWVDAAGSFDPGSLSRAARAVGFDPRGVLSRVELARPMDLYELNELLADKLAHPDPDEALVFSDLLAPLYDLSLSREEALSGFHALLGKLDRLPHFWMALLVSRVAPDGRGGWKETLLKRAQAHACLIEEGGRWQLERLDA